MFVILFISSLLIESASSSLSNTFIFSAGSDTYISFDPWRPCLTGYIRFDIRTNSEDGTLAYIDDRGKFDFFYLKLIEGKPRLLFNLGNDRQALNVNIKINDDKWHTILIKRNGQLTTLKIDDDFAENSILTHSEDLYFGGATYNEYDASPFYFGGIPSILERPTSGNLSSFDVYMQPRFRGQLRNLIYKNCTNSYLIQPVHRQLSGSVSLIRNYYCSRKLCGNGLCLITDNNYKCYCGETDYDGEHCQYEKQSFDTLTFHGKKYLKYDLFNVISSSNEMLTFEFKTNHYDGLLFELIDSQICIYLKQGQLVLEYRINDLWYESSTKDLHLIDNQWHFVQIKRKSGQITILIDQHNLQIDTDIRIDKIFNFTQILIGGNDNVNTKKFHGCLKHILMLINENITVFINQTSENYHQYSLIKSVNCKSLADPIQFLSPSSFISIELEKYFQHMNISFRFETYSSDCILFYSQTDGNFLGLDLIDGFFYITVNMNRNRKRQELFQQRFNDGQSHYIELELQIYQQQLDFNVIVDFRQSAKISVRTSPTKIKLQTLTIGGIDPDTKWLPTNYFSGIMQRGFVGCFSDFEINNQLINLTKYINTIKNKIPPRNGPCSMTLATKHKCLCENHGECRFNSAGSWSCDCTKTGFTGNRCEQLAYHFDLSQISTFELNTNMQWSEIINDISFQLKAKTDEENFLELRPCSLSSNCDNIKFSIRNGILCLNFFSFNLTIDHPILLDKQWHSIYLQRLDTNLFLHVDNSIVQERINIVYLNSSLSATTRIVFYGNKQVKIEDLRLYDQSVYSKYFLNNQYKQFKLKARSWKPINSITIDNNPHSFIEIPIKDILCSECHLDSLYFQFRTKDSNGILFLTFIQVSLSSEKSITNNVQYLLLKLVNGHVHLLIFESSITSPDKTNEIYHLETKTLVSNGRWHHLSFHRATDYHFELTINSNIYYILTPFYFHNQIYFGRTSGIKHLTDTVSMKACFASLTINSQSVNLREFIKQNSSIRNDCFLDSQCRLKTCHNTGICQDRMKCDCRHTSFEGMFCSNLKLGYSFNNSTSGLIFNQPFIKDKLFSVYQLSFGIITKMNISDIIRINDQMSIELYSGSIRVKLNGHEYLQHDYSVNDGYYHLVQIKYNKTGFLIVTVDGKSIMQRLETKLAFDKPLVLFIGQNHMFQSPFQGYLYGLESDMYSIFDLISPTFQRISFSPIRNKSPSTSPSSLVTSIIYPPSSINNDSKHSSCLYEPYDEICVVTAADNYSNSLMYPNVPFQKLSRSTIKSSPKHFSTSTLPYYTFNSTDTYNSSSTNTSDTFRWSEKFHVNYIWLVIVPVLFAIILCLILTMCICVKYHRKDVGVYELEEIQRFRPLIVELPASPGEKKSKKLKSSTDVAKKKITKRKNCKRRTMKTNDQREFFI